VEEELISLDIAAKQAVVKQIRLFLI